MTETDLNPTTWARTIREMTAAGTLRQGVWNAEDEGRHIACILGASSPDVDSVKDVDCAALCMPEWLAELTPPLFDGVPQDQASAYALRYAEAAERWCALTPEAWDRVSVTFRVACIKHALASAKAVQPTLKPDYWVAVEAACEAAIAALKEDDAAGADKAARAARAAARAAAEAAAGAARAAARAAAEAAAGAAAWAAESAAESAAGAAGTATAVGVAYCRLFDALLDAISVELAADLQETTP